MQTRSGDPTIDYITATFVGEEPAWIVPARAEGERRNPGMQISPYEGFLLQWLLRISGAANVLEIGCFAGVSAMWLAGGLPENGQLTSLECAAHHAVAAQEFVAACPHKNRIEIIHTDAHQWLAARPLAPQFDFVFIDADKNGYADYLDAIIPRLNPRGWIVGDNSLLFGVLSGENPDAASPIAKASVTAFNQRLASDPRFEAVLLPTPEGMTVARLR